MKKFLSVTFAMVLVFTLISGPAFAESGSEAQQITGDTVQTVEETGEKSKVMTPESPFYFLKQMVESFRLLLTFDEEAKQELLEKLSTERALELQALMTKYGDEDLTAKQQRRLEKALNRLVNQTERALNDEEIRESAKNMKQAENMYEARIQHMQTLMAKAPEGARKGLAQAIQNAEKQQERKAVQGLNKGDKEDEDGEGGPPEGKGPENNPGKGNGNQGVGTPGNGKAKRGN